MELNGENNKEILKNKVKIYPLINRLYLIINQWLEQC